jgi:tetratricopeptide (TPR) repeat protein
MTHLFSLKNPSRAGLWLRRGILLFLAAALCLALAPALRANLLRLNTLHVLAPAAAQLPPQALLEPLPCERPSLTSTVDRDALQFALGDLERLAAQHPGRAAQRSVGAAQPLDELHLLHARCLLGETGPALDAARAYAAAAPRDSFAFLQLYVALQRRADPQAAALAVSQSPLPLEDALFMTRLLQNVHPDLDALPLLRAALPLAPAEPRLWQLWLQSAALAERRQDWPQARAVYTEALRLQDRHQVRVGRSSFELRLGRLDQVRLQPPDLPAALAAYDRALQAAAYLNKTDESTLHLYRGEVYRALKKDYTPRQALAEFEAALRLQPTSYWAALAVGSVYLSDLKDLEQARLYFELARAIDPKQPNAYLSLGDLARQSGDLPRAAAYYRQALERKPDWQPALDRLKAVESPPEPAK